MQVIEDAKKDILGTFFSCKELDVVDDQDVDHLIKMNEVIGGLILNSVYELVRKFFWLHIQYGFIRKAFFDRNANGMSKVGFT